MNGKRYITQFLDEGKTLIPNGLYKYSNIHIQKGGILFDQKFRQFVYDKNNNIINEASGNDFEHERMIKEKLVIKNTHIIHKKEKILPFYCTMHQ